MSSLVYLSGPAGIGKKLFLRKVSALPIREYTVYKSLGKEDLHELKQKMRRTLEKIVQKHGGPASTYTWAAIAWAKQKGHAPQTLNRTENGRDVPFWASAILWELSTEDDDWHRGWRLLLSGLRASTEHDAPQGDADSIYAAYRLMNMRKQGLSSEDASAMADWMKTVGVTGPLQSTGESTEKRPSAPPRPKASEASKRGPRPRRPGVPPTGPVKIRKIPFTIENPSTMLQEQWWFKDYEKYK